MLSGKQHTVQAETELTRREALVAGAAATPLLAAAIQQAGIADPGEKPVGPILGHVDHETAIIWYRAESPGEYVATITLNSTGRTLSAKANATNDDDLCMTWRFDNLKADAEYAYTITRNGLSLIHISEPTRPY